MPAQHGHSIMISPRLGRRAYNKALQRLGQKVAADFGDDATKSRRVIVHGRRR